tara:strand:- start:12 stop:521 length:510 start_codon:yes stop_codon:yes gene_type:complete
MKHILFIAILAITSTLGAQNFSINTENASVEFYFVTKEVKGTMSKVVAAVEIYSDDISKTKIVGHVDVSTMNTKNEQRDAHLKNEDFFDIEKFPTMSFESSGVTMNGGNTIAKGQLTIKDITKEVTFVLTEEGSTFILTSDIYTSDFGIDVKKEREKNKVEVKIIIPVE